MDRIITLLFFNVINIFDCGMYAISGERVKRVIQGSPVLDMKSTEYEAIRYYVWIANGHNCDSPVSDVVKNAIGKDRNWEFGLLGPFFLKIGYVCAPRPQHLQCSGSLLTPFLVQTACHCLVDFIARDRGVEYPKVFEASEKMFTVHPSKLRVEQIRSDGVFSKAYIAHPKCGRERGSLVHDYGLILLKKSLAVYHRGFAPIYSIQQLGRIWLNAMSKEKVCLIMGFGSFSWISGDDYNDNIPLKSDILRHGWVVAMDYYRCWEKFGRLISNYTEDGTDLCGVSLDGRPGQEVLSAGKGDSGGPVTCDNQYAGLQSEKLYAFPGDFARRRVGFG
ncbi:hypothetical protein GE061_017089 [Apolygus lucorum]|uniref:Peptidase S1 domain-containing protein n=1 Tax=Apolygus lucorum TaxID=248454 RepID=A0A8S9XK28_APOLU|nr:hypothetical protein GE061_017089 [Apolygus lucorum]